MKQDRPGIKPSKRRRTRHFNQDQPQRRGTQLMNTSPSASTSGQFSIRRLFWTMIVASIVFKLADMTGFLHLIAGNWYLARGTGRAWIIFSIVLFTIIAIVYIAWFGIRLPYLIEQRIVQRKKRQQRRDQFQKEIEAHRKRV